MDTFRGLDWTGMRRFKECVYVCVYVMLLLWVISGGDDAIAAI